MLIALTIDAEHPDRMHCPPGVLDQTLDVLDSSRISATFFIQGRWASAYPEQAKSIASAGHLLGNHSHFHAAMSLLDAEAIRVDIEAASRAIIEATGSSPKPWFRLPFLNGADDDRVVQVIDFLGYRHVGVHAAPGDWFPDRSATDLADLTIEQLGGRGGIVLFHSWPAQVPDTLRALIPLLNDLEVEFIRVDDPRAEELIRSAKPSPTQR